jgi:hypothetical protein
MYNVEVLLHSLQFDSSQNYLRHSCFNQWSNHFKIAVLLWQPVLFYSNKRNINLIYIISQIFIVQINSHSTQQFPVDIEIHKFIYIYPL